jgi:hypothetical protein
MSKKTFEPTKKKKYGLLGTLIVEIVKPIGDDHSYVTWVEGLTRFATFHGEIVPNDTIRTLE